VTLQINQPAELADHDLSAGPMIRAKIVPGQPGNWFGKVSRGARAAGDVSVREAFVANETPDNSAMDNVGVIISATPAAEGVDVVLFRVPGKDWAYRSEAVAFIEGYTQAGQEMDWRIFGSHLEGFRTLRLWGLPSSPLPGIGDTVFVSDETPGVDSSQALRISGLSFATAIYGEGAENSVEYINLLLELSAPLEADINGTSVPGLSLPTTLEKVRAGQVSDNSQYFGASALTLPVAVDDLDVVVDSVFAPIVPASQSSSAITDAPALPRTTRRVTSGDGYEFTDPAGPAHTDSLAITGANRQTTYSLSLVRLPAAGSFVLKYQSLGRWVTLRDNGDGTFGTPGQGGSGVVSAATGSVTANLDRAPDLDSYLVWSWGSYEQFARIDDALLPPAVIDRVLLPGSEPGSLLASWTEGGQAKSLADDGAGNLTGDATGKYYYGSGRLVAQTATLPDGPINWSAVDGATVVDLDAIGLVTVTAGRVLFTVAQSLPIAPGAASVEMMVAHRFPDGAENISWGNPFVTPFRDDGAGNMIGYYGANGTVDYATGAYDLPEVAANHTTALRDDNRWVAQQVSTWFTGLGPLRVQHSATGGANTVSGVLSGYAMQINLDTVDPLVAGALVFTLGGETYRGIDGGGLSKDGTPGVSAGSVANDGTILVDAWGNGASNAPVLLAALARGEDWAVTTIHWAALGFPLAAGQLSMLGTAATGEPQNAGTDVSGQFTGDATGSMDFDSGFGLTTWALPMDPASITHSGVVLTLLPLDKDLIGIDASRLPVDGKVPIFNRGGLLTVGDKQDQVMPSPLTAGQVVPLDLPDLTTVLLLDATGLVVDAALYVTDLEADQLTMATPLDLSAYVEPLTAELHWDDEAVIVDVQPNGTLTLAQGLPRAYGVGAMASAIVSMGDMQAHTALFFDQKTWDGTSFTDERVGDPAGGTYNVAGFPVEVDNDQAPTENWVVHFVNTTSVEIIGEHHGNLGTFDFTSDLQPVDPANGLVLFRLRAAGRGDGWDPGNIIRFKIVTAAGHYFGLRCISMGAENLGTDEVVLRPRGEV